MGMSTRGASSADMGTIVTSSNVLAYETWIPSNDALLENVSIDTRIGYVTCTRGPMEIREYCHQM
jgi:hypothetical protein